MITYAVESYSSIVDKIKPLLVAHWQELAVHKDIPLDPDLMFYEQAWTAGMLLIISAMDGEHLVGYAIFVVRKSHAHYRKHSWAVNDIIRVLPGSRRQGVGQGLVDFWERELKAMGVNVIHVNEKVSSPELGDLLMNNGYSMVEYGREKRIQ